VLKGGKRGSVESETTLEKGLFKRRCMKCAKEKRERRRGKIAERLGRGGKTVWTGKTF